MNRFCERCTLSEILCECEDEMPPFTDDDLKRLKEYVETCIANQEKDRGTADSILEVAPYEFRALLARLEAAENFHRLVMENFRARMPQKLQDADEAWRKAAGK